MGAPFEGIWSDDIPCKEQLLSHFHEYHGYPTGQYTDDTQLTIATVRSIVDNGEIVVPEIARSISELWRHHSVIGPGGACTQAAERFLATEDCHSMGAPMGQAGNGTAMRTAALGLWFGEDREQLVSTVAEISKLTHQDPRSIAGGVVIALAANILANDNAVDAEELCGLLSDSIRTINGELSELIQVLPSKMEQQDCMRFIAAAGQTVEEFSAPIISPFVIPTVLASIYCVVRNRDSWTDAVTDAIQLGGDVDTLGAIVGALVGAANGVDSIPQNLRAEVLDSEAILALGFRFHALIEQRQKQNVSDD